MPGFKLYEIDKLLQDTVDAVLIQAEQAEGEIEESWSEFLDTVRMERDQKALGLARYIKNITAESEAVQEEKQKLAKRQSILENRAMSIKAYLCNHLQSGEKLADANTVISWRESSSVEIGDVAKLPICYVRTEIIPDKTALKKALQDGEQIPECVIVKKNSIQIR